MSDDKVPLCAILIPAPWQVQDTKKHPFWVREKTPLSERSEELAEGLRKEDSITEEIPKNPDTRLPVPEPDTLELDLWDSDDN
jgi:hypothetical protein